MTTNAVLVHADAGKYEGWGHLRESLEVAKALRLRGVKSLIVVPAGVAGAAAEARDGGFEVVEVPPEDWRTNEAPRRIIGLLDTHDLRHAVCDLVTVPNAYVQAMNGATDGWACITELPEDEVAPININISLAPEYVPLGSGYRGAHAHAIRDSIRQVLVCYGGSDPRNVTGETLGWLRPAVERGILARDGRIVAVLGPLFTSGDAVRSIAAGYPIEVDVRGPITPNELAQLASSSDVAITTSGGTMYEFSALGLPSIVVPVLPKHLANAGVLEDLGAVVTTRLCDQVTAAEMTAAIERLAPAEVREALSQAGQREIDGMGASRIAERLCREWGIG